MVAPDISGGWIMDTGATYSLRDLDSIDFDCLIEAKKPVTVRAASGPSVLDKDAQIRVPSLEEAGAPYALQGLRRHSECHISATIGDG